MNRIQFSVNAGGGSPYTLILNPTTLELNDNESKSSTKILDGATVEQGAFFDSRPIVMTWSRIPKAFANFPTMLDTLKSYVGNIMYVHYQDVDYRATTSTWDKIRVADIDIKTVHGGTIKYNVKVTLNPEN